MAITTTWTVNDMTRLDADGGVITVYWQCVASDGTYSATEAGKLACNPDPTAPGFIPYADLTQDDVLAWVYASLSTGEETPAEAKARVEADRSAKVQAQIDRANTQAGGVPWATEPAAA